MEHRWGQRHRLEYVVSVSAGSWRAIAQVRDISVSGALLRCLAPRDRMKRICVEFPSSARNDVLMAQVVRRTNDSVGIEWLEFAPDLVLRMLEGVKAARPQPVRRGRVAA
jgi:hypothetical protein